jgi:hypothetical protein
MHFQNFSKTITNRSFWYYSIESMSVHLGPCLFLQLLHKVLDVDLNREVTGVMISGGGRPRRRQRRGAVAVEGSRAPVETRGMAVGGSWPSGHGDQRPNDQCSMLTVAQGLS